MKITATIDFSEAGSQYEGMEFPSIEALESELSRIAYKKEIEEKKKGGLGSCHGSCFKTLITLHTGEDHWTFKYEIQAACLHKPNVKWRVGAGIEGMFGMFRSVCDDADLQAASRWAEYLGIDGCAQEAASDAD